MYPQRLHFLQHFFFLVFTFLLLSQVSLQHVQTPHTFSILHNAKKIQFRFEIFRFQSQNTDHAYNTLLKYARSREKYTAGGKKNRENTVV